MVQIHREVPHLNMVARGPQDHAFPSHHPVNEIGQDSWVLCYAAGRKDDRCSLEFSVSAIKPSLVGERPSLTTRMEPNCD